MRISILGGGKGSPAGMCHRAALSIDRKHQIDSGIFSRNEMKNLDSFIEWKPECMNNFLDIKQLSSRKDIDCLSIITPTPDHFSNIIVAKDLYKNIICEKALCCSLDEALELREKLKGKNLFVIYNYTGYPIVKIAKKIIENKEIGNISEIHAKMPQRSFLKRVSLSSNEKNGPQSWRLSEGSIPNIDLDLGTHLHNLIEYVTGHKLINVIGNQRLSKIFHVKETSHYLFRTDRDAIGSMIHGKANLREDNGLYLEVVGEKGTISWKQSYPEDLEITNEKGRQILTRADFFSNDLIKCERMKPGHPSGFIEALANYYNSIENFILNNKEKENVFGIETAIKGLAFFESANRSIRSNKWEVIDSH